MIGCMVPAHMPQGGTDLWSRIGREAIAAASVEPHLRDVLNDAVIAQRDFKDALSAVLARQLQNEQMSFEALRALHGQAVGDDPSIVEAAIDDLTAVFERDPAASDVLTPFLYFKGFHALQWHRVAHRLWARGRKPLALFLQSRVSRVLAIDIHPAVPIGRGVFIDHGTGVVIGETAVIGNNVSILHEVTLGGTGKEAGDRHPKIDDGVLIAAGAKVLGNIHVGRGAKIGAGSVVVKNVPAWATAVGVPARIVATGKRVMPALEMNQGLPPLNYSI